MYDRDITCCFTGHRPANLPWGSREDDSRCVKMRFELKCRMEGIYMAGYRRFISGMALGCDSFFAQEALELRRQYGDVTLEAAVPCASQSLKWSGRQRAQYQRLLDQCDKVTVLQQDYTPDCMMRRNRYMVDNSSLLLCCFNGRPSGTLNTIRYARQQGLKLLMIEV